MLVLRTVWRISLGLIAFAFCYETLRGRWDDMEWLPVLAVATAVALYVRSVKNEVIEHIAAKSDETEAPCEKDDIDVGQ